MTVFGCPYRKEEKNMLINYLNVVGGQLVDFFSPAVMDGEPWQHVATMSPVDWLEGSE